MEFVQIKEYARQLKETLGSVVLGQEETITQVIAALFAGGHVLLEEVPGSGKTLLAKTLASCIDGSFSRMQMTPDLLPSDLTGINYFNRKTGEFQFRKGPVFSNILIADEINRATPKTQAGLLEAMEEGQVSVDGETYLLPEPFMVIATQNPVDSQGVFPLPEAQIDRFLCKLHMESKDCAVMAEILKLHGVSAGKKQIKSVLSTGELMEIRSKIETVEVHDDLYAYIVMIMEASRKADGVILGMSGRGGIALLRMAKARAAMEGRDYLLPDDIKAVAIAVCSHRLVLKSHLRVKKGASELIMEEILKSVPVPTEQEEL